MSAVVWAVVIVTIIWVLVDAKKIGVQKGQITGIANMGPWSWFVVCLLLWVVGFPLYLVKRKQYQQINATKGL